MAASGGRIIGVDFDNTLVDYGDILHAAAVERGLIPPSARKDKNGIRDRIRGLRDGESEWRKLQALVYGARIGEARLFEGADLFLTRCKRMGIPVYIVSHKTEYAAAGEEGINLRASALAWMTAQGFFRADGFALSAEMVFFDSTRLEKVQRIRLLACTHFIDDLEETFLEETFPAAVDKILFAPQRRQAALRGVRIMGSWREICAYLFAATA
jgi:hypothetical protein